MHQSYGRHLLFGELFTTIQDDLFFVKTLPGIFQMTGFRLAYLYKVIHTNESLVLLHNLFTHLFCFFKGTAVLTYQSNMTKYYADSPVFYRNRQSDANYMICHSCFSPYRLSNYHQLTYKSFFALCMKTSKIDYIILRENTFLAFPIDCGLPIHQ